MTMATLPVSAYHLSNSQSHFRKLWMLCGVDVITSVGTLFSKKDSPCFLYIGGNFVHWQVQSKRDSGPCEERQ